MTERRLKETVETLVEDVFRLSVLLQDRQEIIHEVAAREPWLEKAFAEIDFDKETNLWLEHHLGEVCSKLVIAEEHRFVVGEKRGHELMSWGISLQTLQQVDPISILDLFTFNEVDDRVRLLCTSKGRKENLPVFQSAACLLLNLRDDCVISRESALGVLLSTLCLNDESSAEGFAKTDILPEEVSSMIVHCAKVFNPEMHFSVVNGLDMLTMMFAKNRSPSAFVGTVLSQRVLMQGIFHAARMSAVCRPLGIAEELLGGGKSISRLNFVDFFAAPVWIALSRLVPKLREPTAHMIRNRAVWDEKARTESVSSELKDILQARESAFYESFAHSRFEADAALVSIGAFEVFLRLLKGSGSLRAQQGDLLLADCLNHCRIAKSILEFPKQRTTLIGSTRSFFSRARQRKTAPRELVDDNKLVIMPKPFLLRKRKSGNENPVERYKRLRSILEHRATNVLLAILTLFALFGDDFKLAVLPKSADPVFGFLALFTLVTFSLEVVAKWWTVPMYKNSFYFFLDLLAAISLMPEVPFIWSLMVAAFDLVTSDVHADDLTLTKAGRASRAGARAARFIRILRIVRLLRLLKLYEYSLRRPQKTPISESRYRMNRKPTKKQESSFLQPSPVESNVGAKLADLTTRRVIVFVLLILFALPWINIYEEDNDFEAALGMVHASSVQYYNGRISEEGFLEVVDGFVLGNPHLLKLRCDAFDSEVFLFKNTVKTTLLRTAELRDAVQFCNIFDDEFGSDDRIPKEERIFCIVPKGDNRSSLLSYGAFDNREFERALAWRSILQTVFIILVFTIATMIFTHDAHRLVIAPIERMVRIVQQLAENPLTTFDNDDEEDACLLEASNSNAVSGETYETKLLENSIKKVGNLLKVGFGEAGAKIIAESMNSCGELDPMVSGKKVDVLLGFCSIDQFDKLSEILQENIVLLVNEIASIVHECVSAHEGSILRNNGEKIAVAWKLSRCDQTWNKTAEKALIGLLRVIVELEKKECKRLFAANSEVGKKLRNAGMTKTPISFSLHFGWAIEGAIGSREKIDAGYISPNMRLAESLQELNTCYGTTLLFTEQMHNLLGVDAQRCCRLVDVVMIKHSRAATKLYTFDCVLDGIQKRFDAIQIRGQENQDDDLLYVVDHKISLVGPTPIIQNEQNVVEVTKSAFRTDLELRALQWKIPPPLIPLCRKAVLMFANGDWNQAKTLLDAACEISPSEIRTSCERVLEFMQSFNFEAPSDWPGFRRL